MVAVVPAVASSSTIASDILSAPSARSEHSSCSSLGAILAPQSACESIASGQMKAMPMTCRGRNQCVTVRSKSKQCIRAHTDKGEIGFLHVCDFTRGGESV